MAIDDVSFYNLIGEEISRETLVNQMINYYIMKLEVGETKVTDFNEGSEIRNLLEAIAVDLYALMDEQNELIKIGFIDSAEGEFLDKHGANPFINLERDTGSEATGYVVFTIPEVLASDLIIEEGTLVATEDGLEFATDGEGLISAGETTSQIPVTCLTVGADGNVGIGEITVIDDENISIPGLTVNNTEALTNGTDYEEDEEYRERLLAYVRQDDFGSMGYYTKLGEEIDGVHDVLLVDNASYTKSVIVNGDEKPVSASVVANVLSEFSKPENIVVGHTFTAVACECDSVDLTVNLGMQEEIDDTIIENVLQTFFDGGEYELYDFEGLYINDSVTNEKLVDILSLLEEVVSIEILYNGSQLTEVSPATNHVLSLGTVTVNQTVV